MGIGFLNIYLLLCQHCDYSYFILKTDFGESAWQLLGA